MLLVFGKAKKRLEYLEEENKLLKKEIREKDENAWDLIDVIKKVYNTSNDGLQKPAYSKESLKVKLREIREMTAPINKKYEKFGDVILGGKKNANR